MNRLNRNEDEERQYLEISDRQLVVNRYEGRMW